MKIFEKSSISKYTALLALLLSAYSLYGQSAAVMQFTQDVAVTHGTEQGLPPGSIEDIFIYEGQPVCLTAGRYYTWNGKIWMQFDRGNKREIPGSPASPPSCTMLSFVPYNEGFAIGCDKGLYFLDKKTNTWKPVTPEDETYHWTPDQVGALALDSKGRLWFGAKQGVGCFDGTKWELYTGEEGLPYNHFTCAAAGPDGTVWFGTEKGAIRVEDGYFYYRFTRRWLPDDHVTAIAVQEDGTAWIGTKKGISRITPKPMTLDEKAHIFTRQVEDRHVRMGFVCQSKLKKQYDISTSTLDVSDNDGMYTAMYGASQAFRYAVTGDPEAKKIAVRSMKSLQWLVNITHDPGFPARVIIPADWEEPLKDKDHTDKVNQRVRQHDPFWKTISPRYVKNADGSYYWKCDTSSDELAGHYFFYGVFYDLAAETEEEKALVREVVAAVTDHLIKNGFLLRDWDGLPTRWGNFSPEYVNSEWGWDQRGLNSMMMLSFLNVAKHITGDVKYDEAAALLRDKYNYHINAMHAKEFFPPDNVVPWDNNLSLMSLYGLINYEEDPELLIMYRTALEYAWLHISKQKNAFWDAVYAALANHFNRLAENGYFDHENIFPENPLFAPLAVKQYREQAWNAENILETLQRIPLDLIGYSMDNTHRLDVRFDPTPGQDPAKGWRVDTYALPVDERGHVRQDRDGFALVASEGNGWSEHEGTFFLLPYYMTMHHRLLDDPALMHYQPGLIKDTEKRK